MMISVCIWFILPTYLQVQPAPTTAPFILVETAGVHPPPRLLVDLRTITSTSPPRVQKFPLGLGGSSLFPVMLLACCCLDCSAPKLSSSLGAGNKSQDYGKIHCCHLFPLDSRLHAEITGTRGYLPLQAEKIPLCTDTLTVKNYKDDLWSNT